MIPGRSQATEFASTTPKPRAANRKMLRWTGSHPAVLPAIVPSFRMSKYPSPPGGIRMQAVGASGATGCSAA